MIFAVAHAPAAVVAASIMCPRMSETGRTAGRRGSAPPLRCAGSKYIHSGLGSERDRRMHLLSPHTDCPAPSGPDTRRRKQSREEVLASYNCSCPTGFETPQPPTLGVDASRLLPERKGARASDVRIAATGQSMRGRPGMQRQGHVQRDDFVTTLPKFRPTSVQEGGRPS